MNSNEIIGAVFIALATIIGLYMTIGKPIITLNTTITKLSVTVDNLQKTVDRLEAKQKADNGKVWEQLDKHDVKIEEHNRRLDRLEIGGTTK